MTDSGVPPRREYYDLATAKEWAADPRTSEIMFARLFESWPEVHHHLASNPSTPVHILDRLALDPRPEVQAALTSNETAQRMSIRPVSYQANAPGHSQLPAGARWACSRCGSFLNPSASRCPGCGTVMPNANVDAPTNGDITAATPFVTPPAGSAPEPTRAWAANPQHVQAAATTTTTTVGGAPMPPSAAPTAVIPTVEQAAMAVGAASTTADRARDNALGPAADVPGPLRDRTLFVGRRRFKVGLGPLGPVGFIGFFSALALIAFIALLANLLSTTRPQTARRRYPGAPKHVGSSGHLSHVVRSSGRDHQHRTCGCSSPGDCRNLRSTGTSSRAACDTVPGNNAGPRHHRSGNDNHPRHDHRPGCRSRAERGSRDRGRVAGSAICQRLGPKERRRCSPTQPGA